MKKAKTQKILPQSGDLILRPDAGDRNTPGEFYFANESRFNESAYTQSLTDFAVGWRQPTDLLKTLDFIAPSVQVSRKFEFKSALNAEAYLSETDDERAIGADFKMVEYKGITTLEKTINRGLTMRIDRDWVSETPDWELKYTGRLLDRLYRNELRRALAILAALAVNTNKTWDVNAKPDNDVRDMVTTSGDTRGIDANRVVFGYGAWNLRLSALGLQANNAASQMYQQTPEQLALFYGVEKVEIAKHRYQNAATTKAQMLGNTVVAFYALDEAVPEDPSDLKRFWTPCENGLKFAVYLVPVGSKFVDLTVECYSKVIGTGTVGVRKLTVS
jgi:hypothetical protein